MTQHSESSRYPRSDKAITQIFYQLTNCLKNELQIVFAYMVLRSFFTRERQHGDKNVVEGALQTILIAEADRQFARARIGDPPLCDDLLERTFDDVLIPVLSLAGEERAENYIIESEFAVYS